MPPVFTELYHRLAAIPWVRRAAWLLFLSWVVALTLTGYIFGLGEGFWGKWFEATLVLWLLTAGTVLGIVPLLAWLTRRLSNGDTGKGSRPARAIRKPAPKRSARPPAPQLPANRPRW